MKAGIIAVAAVALGLFSTFSHAEVTEAEANSLPEATLTAKVLGELAPLVARTRRPHGQIWAAPGRPPPGAHLTFFFQGDPTQTLGVCSFRTMDLYFGEKGALRGFSVGQSFGLQPGATLKESKGYDVAAIQLCKSLKDWHDFDAQSPWSASQGALIISKLNTLSASVPPYSLTCNFYSSYPAPIRLKQPSCADIKTREDLLGRFRTDTLNSAEQVSCDNPNLPLADAPSPSGKACWHIHANSNVINHDDQLVVTTMGSGDVMQIVSVVYSEGVWII